MKYLAMASTAFVAMKDTGQLEAVWRLVVEHGTATPSAETDHSQAMEDTATMPPGGNTLKDAEGDGNIDDDYHDHPLDISGLGKSKCLVLRVLNKLSRYYNAGSTITTALLRMFRRTQAEIQIRTAEIRDEPADSAIDSYAELASSVGVHEDGFDPLLRRLAVPLLHAASQQRLSSKWKNRVTKSKVYVHVELQLAIYYLANDERHPLWNYGDLKKDMLGL